jgi:murein tripeptide amidase MpaA
MTDEDATDSSEEESPRQSKVRRVITDRELEDLGAELERRWTAEGPSGMSLRELADLFNQRALRATMEREGMQVLEGEAENIYELLTSDDVSVGSRVQVERRLEREGIDVQSLTSDFVSHQAVYTYLKKHRGASAPTSEAATDMKTQQVTIQRLRNRLIAVVTNTIESLRANGQLTLGAFDVFVSVQVRCDDCGKQLMVADLFEQGGCEC